MSASTNGGGTGFTGLLTLIFVTLKLIGKIDWSWWWVLSPILIVIALLVILCLLWLTAVVMEKS